MVGYVSTSRWGSFFSSIRFLITRVLILQQWPEAPVSYIHVQPLDTLDGSTVAQTPQLPQCGAYNERRTFIPLPKRLNLESDQHWHNHVAARVQLLVGRQQQHLCTNTVQTLRGYHSLRRQYSSWFHLFSSYGDTLHILNFFFRDQSQALESKGISHSSSVAMRYASRSSYVVFSLKS